MPPCCHRLKQRTRDLDIHRRSVFDDGTQAENTKEAPPTVLRHVPLPVAPSSLPPPPGGFRMAGTRRSSSREEALGRKNSLTATSRPERLLRACVRMPVQAARLVQSGVRNSVSQSVGTVQAVLRPRAADEAGAGPSAPSLLRAEESGWKSRRLRDAIQNRDLAATMEQKQLENERLEAMVETLLAKLALATASTGGEKKTSQAECATRLSARRMPPNDASLPRSVRLPRPASDVSPGNARQRALGPQTDRAPRRQMELEEGSILSGGTKKLCAPFIRTREWWWFRSLTGASL